MNLYIDLETIPCQRAGILEQFRAEVKAPGNLSKPESITKWLEENGDAAAQEALLKTSFDGALGEIACLGFAFDDEPVHVPYRETLEQSETSLLTTFFGAWESAVNSRNDGLVNTVLIGHNVLQFDLRFLFKRAVINGIQPPYSLCQDSRYNGGGIYDTMLAWAGWGNRISLVKLCAALGIPVKTDGIDGSMVWPMIQAGRVAEVAGYCAEDVEAVRSVYKRMTFQ